MCAGYSDSGTSARKGNFRPHNICCQERVHFYGRNGAGACALNDEIGIIQGVGLEACNGNILHQSSYAVYTAMLCFCGVRNQVVAANQVYEVDCSKMDLAPNSNYIFLAVGKSDTGSADAFRATYPVTLTDRTPPVVLSTGHNLTINENGIISGQVTLNFSENLYYLATNASAEENPKKLCFHENGPGTDNESASALNLCYSPGIGVLMERTAHVPGTSTPEKPNNDSITNRITLEFNQATKNAKVTFSNELTDRAGNRIDTITVSLKLVNNNEVVVLVNGKEI